MIAARCFGPGCSRRWSSTSSIALWVFHDARARGARKPRFAAVLALVWGPLGLGLWVSDRPLRQGEQRRAAPGQPSLAGS